MTNWRDLGDTDQASFLAAIKGTPLEAEGPAIYSAMRPHTRLGWAQMRWESGLGTSALAQSAHNVLGQRPRPGDNGPTVPGPFRVFTTFAECAQYWHDKITSPTYAYKDTVTLADYIHIYSPDSDNAPGQEAEYVAYIEGAVNGLPKTGGTSMPNLNMTKGLIPLPPTIDDIIDVSQRDQSSGCRGYDNLGTRPETPKFLVLHRSLNGAAQSNSGYFHNECCPALTDLEVIAATGVGRRFVRRGNAPSGWANGVVSAPYGDALAWLNLHNWDLNTVNRDGESVEITGFQMDPVSEAAWEWLAQWIASRAHDYGITYETFPLIPAEGNRSYLTWHTEWTVGTGKLCPWSVVTNYTNTLVERARAIMMETQTNSGEQPAPTPPPPPKYVDPLDLPWFDQDLERGYPTDHVWDSEEFGRVQVFAALRPYQSLREANRLRGPDIKSGRVGPRLKVRESFRGPYTMKVNGRVFVLTYGRSFVDAGTLTPRVSVVPR